MVLFQSVFVATAYHPDPVGVDTLRLQHVAASGTVKSDILLLASMASEYIAEKLVNFISEVKHA